MITALSITLALAVTAYVMGAAQDRIRHELGDTP